MANKVSSVKVISDSLYDKCQSFMMTNIMARREISKNLNSPERKVSDFLIDHIDFSVDNITVTYKQIMKGAHVSRDTVAMALKRLTNLSIIKHFTGVIYFNPKVVLVGSEYKRKKLYNIYKELG